MDSDLGRETQGVWRLPGAQLRVFLVLLAVFGLITARMVLPYTLALFMGGVMAIVVMPLQRRLAARGLKPHRAAALVTFLMIVVVVGPLLTFATMAIRQAVSIGQFLIAHAEGLSLGDVLERLGAWAPTAALIESVPDIEAVAREGMQELGRFVTAQLVAIAKSIPNVVLQTVLACLACYFFLFDGKKFVTWLSSKLPIDQEIRGRLMGSFHDTAISAVWATMAAAATQAVVMLLGFSILRVPAAALAFGSTFVLAFIPIVGSTPVWLAGAGWLWFAADAPVRAGILVLLGLFTGVIDNVVRPLVLRGRGEMHPLVSLVAILGGLQLFGVFGVLAGPIMAAIVITLLQIWPVVFRRAETQKL